MSTVLVTGTDTPVVTVAEVKAQGRISIDDDDVYIEGLIEVATQYAETYTSRSLINKTYDMKLDRFPWVIEPNLAPLVSVTTLSYLDENGDSQTLVEGTDFDVDIASEPGRICPDYGSTWPGTRPVANAVTIRYVAGYGTAASSTPAAIRHAVKGYALHLYEFREPVVVIIGGSPIKVPLWIDSLLTPWRLV